MPWRALEKNSESWSRDLLCKTKGRWLRTFHSKQELQKHTDCEWLESEAIDIVDVAVILDPDMKGECFFDRFPDMAGIWKKKHVCRFPDFPDVEHLEICEGRRHATTCVQRVLRFLSETSSVRCRSVMSSWQDVLKGVYDCTDRACAQVCWGTDTHAEHNQFLKHLAIWNSGKFENLANQENWTTQHHTFRRPNKNLKYQKSLKICESEKVLKSGKSGNLENLKNLQIWEIRIFAQSGNLQIWTIKS